MKKIAVFAIVISAIFLAVLSPFPTAKAWDYYDEDCVCDHFDEGNAYTIWDMYTGTAVHAEGWYEYGYFEYFYVDHTRGLGGYYSPAPPLVDQMTCMDEWFDWGMGYRYTYDINSPIPWTYPFDPFNQGFDYHVQESIIPQYPIQCLYVGGTTDSYFPWPPFPTAMWFDEGSRAYVPQ